jgi:hypothetical protein
LTSFSVSQETGAMLEYHGHSVSLEWQSPHAVAEELQQWRATCPHSVRKDAPVFPSNRGTPLNQRNWRNRVYYDARKRSGVVAGPPYDLRHTWATQMLYAGHAPWEVAMKLGHSNTAMLEKHYAHEIEEAKLVPPAERVSFEDAIDAARAVSLRNADRKRTETHLPTSGVTT